MVFSRYYQAMNPEDPKHIAALLERISRLISNNANVEGLKPVQWEALRYLAKANRFSNTATALTRYLGLTKATVSQSLMALERKGLVRKKADGRDRRSIRLSLTTQGKRMLSNDSLRDTEAAIRVLPEAARRQLGKGLGALLSARLAAQDGLPFGQCHNCRYFARNHPEGGPHRCQLAKEKLSETEADNICVEQSPIHSVAYG